MKSLMKADEDLSEVDCAEENNEDLKANFQQECEEVEKKQTSPLYICKKTKLEILKTYDDNYPFLEFRKKFLHCK